MSKTLTIIRILRRNTFDKTVIQLKYSTNWKNIDITFESNSALLHESTSFKLRDLDLTTRSACAHIEHVKAASATVTWLLFQSIVEEVIRRFSILVFPSIEIYQASICSEQWYGSTEESNCRVASYAAVSRLKS